MEKAVAVFDLERTLFKPSRSFIREIPKGRVGGIAGVVKVAIFNISFMMIYIYSIKYIWLVDKQCELRSLKD